MDGSGRTGVIVGGIAFALMSAILPAFMAAKPHAKPDRTQHSQVAKPDQGALAQLPSLNPSTK